MKKILTLVCAIVLMSFNCMAQSEEEEAQLFGYTRKVSLTSANVLGVIDFGKLDKNIVERTLTIDNDKNHTMKITGFILPTGVSAMSLQKNIEEFGKGKVKIAIDPNYVDAVNGENLIINVSYFDRSGNQVNTAQLVYKISVD